MHTLSEDKIKANQVEGDINLTATRKQWQDKFLSEKSKKLLDEDIDILPMPKCRGFLDTNDTCLLKNSRSYYISPKKVDAPTFHIFIAAFLSLSWLVLHFAQIHSRTAKFLVSGFFVPQTWQICELG